MPSAWSWYQIVDARWEFGYWKVAKPGPHRRRTRRGLVREEVVPGALRGVALGDVVRVGQVPRLRVAVALVADARRAVHVGHVARARCSGWGVVSNVGRMSRSSIPPGRVRPVEGRVDGEQVWQGVAVPSTRSLIHFTRTGRFHLASIVSDGALWRSPRLLPSGRPRIPRPSSRASLREGSAGRTASSRSRRCRSAGRRARVLPARGITGGSAGA